MMSHPRQPRIEQAREQGGIVILLAFIILTIMTVAAFGVSRTSLRDLAMVGNESTGRKASEAADSGMDWTITWSNPSAGSRIVSATTSTGGNASYISQDTLTGAAAVVQTRMADLLAAIGDSTLRVSKSDPVPNSSGDGNYGNMSSKTGALRFFMRSLDYTPSTAPELFQTGYTTGSTTFLQPSQVQQAFDAEVRYLGDSFASKASGSRAKKQGGLFLISIVGRANIQGTTQSFIARREALVDYTP
jgi:Tfp pilus assembly protein PilX